MNIYLFLRKFKMKIIQELKQSLPKEVVLTKNTDVFECDGLTTIKENPQVVVLPENIEQIQNIIKICQKYNTSLVPRGAGTGLSGGATPIKDSVVLGFARLNQVLEFNSDEKYMRVQPGVINSDISKLANTKGLYYAPDPSSQIACTIGGNVAENSGGVHCLKYGLTVHNIISLKFLTATGELIEVHKDDDNLGLLSLFIGSEGLLGLVVEITVKLLNIPAQTKTIMASFADISSCANAVGEIISSGVIPAGLEMMDAFTIQAANDFLGDIYPANEALLLCELDGAQDEVNRDETQVLEVLQNATNIQVANDSDEIALLWKGRKNAFPAVGRISPDYYCMDGTIPKRHLAEVLTQINQLSKKYNLRVANVFHAGDGNLHPLILYDAAKGEIPKAEELGEEILKTCVDYGGTITGEHGVGLEKLNSMCYQFGDKELKIFHQIKAAFDENKIFNPTKAVPTLHRCAEVGRMHIHNNELPYPHLERF
jgi:glycolate oxidase